MFDDTFSTELVLYVYHLFMASTAAKYHVTYKARKMSMGHNTCFMDFSTPMKSRVSMKSEFTNKAAMSTVKSVFMRKI